MKLDPKIVAHDFESAFGAKITVQQAWFIAKLAKHVRLRCRNNAAFNNFFNQCFPNLSFREVQKIDSKTGQPYEGLEITER